MTAVDDPALVSGDLTGSGLEDATAITGTLAATDIEGLTDSTYFAITAGLQPSHGSASINAATGAWSYTPTANFNGNDSFSITITDDLGGTTSQTIAITVTAVDDPALVSGDLTGSGLEDATAITGTLAATDIEGLTDSTYFAITAGLQPSHGSASINAATGAWSYTPTANFNGNDSFSITITDDLGGTTSQTIAITVTAVDDPPLLISAGTITSVLEDSNNTSAIALWSTAPAYSVGGGADEASQTLSYTISSIPAFINLFKADGSTAVAFNTTLSAADFAALKYKTIANANGTSSIGFTVTDSGSSTTPNNNTLASQTVSMTVTAVDNDSDGASNTFEIGKDNNKDGIDDSQQTDVATFTSSNGISSLAINNPALEHLSDPNGGKAVAKTQLVFEQATTDANARQGLQLGIQRDDSTLSVNSTSELISFALKPSVSTDGDVSNLDINDFRNRNIARFKSNIQEVELYFQESDPSEQDWNTVYKTRKNPDNSLDYYLFNYDPITGLGGILVDRNNNGRVDGAKLYLKDGALGDFDGDENGEIVDPVGFASISAIPTLKVTDDKKGFKVDGLSGTGLWIKLSIQAFNTFTQSNLELFVSDSSAPNSYNSYGAIGATLGGGPSGETNLYLSAGSTLKFRYSNGLGQTNTNPAIAISNTTKGFSLGLDSNLDGNYNDLRVDIISTVAVNSPADMALARKQLTSSDAILDLTSIAASGIKLSLLISTDCALHNQFGFVKLEIDPITGTTYQANGVSQDNSTAFRDSIRTNCINPFQQTPGTSHKFGQSLQSITWSLDSTQSGYYAPVMITQGGEVLTFGASTASDGRQHVKLLGTNTFGFEDLLASQDSDWDFNDTKIRVTVGS